MRGTINELFKLTSILLLFISLAECSDLLDRPNRWAVLVAGSNGYYNYRHQADICHAYHILREHGVPAENIITMFYDDIAYNKDNPLPGTIINAVNGSNVYEGVVKDYIGQDVNSTNFLKVLLGDEEGMEGIGSGRVLKSGPNDYVFINFADHGAEGLICFPNDTDVLYADDFVSTLNVMHIKNMFAKMVIYIEACESGSMFDRWLRENVNIFAVTAAKRGEDSYACCWDDIVQSYLGDVFSVNWMDDSDWEDLSNETLSQQFMVVVQETNTSHPQEFGTLSIGELPVGDFMGKRTFPKPSEQITSRCDDAVRSPDVPVAVLQRKLENAETADKQSYYRGEIRKLFKLRRTVDQVVKHILTIVYSDNDLVRRIQRRKSETVTKNFPCYKKLTRHWLSNCYGQSSNPYALQKMHVFSNVCEQTPDAAKSIMDAMDSVCANISVRKGIL